MTTRRALLASMLGMAALGGTAQAQSRPVGDIRIDLSGLRGDWSGPLLRAIDASLRRALDSAFPNRGAGPTLVVSVDRVTLAMFAGSGYNHGGARGGGGSNDGTDYMEGRLTLVGRNNAIISQQPLLVSQMAAAGGSWWSDDNDTRRVAALANAYGYWARRQLA
ncbi:MAG: hypothetical protein J0H41_09065 [Rhizobiales bacterium]|nr:hypothetical protein [Hyphomicrobiales bacterium]